MAQTIRSNSSRTWRITCTICGKALHGHEHVMCDECLYDDEGLFEGDE